MSEDVIKVLIANIEYKIKLGEQDPNYIKQLATYVDLKILELQKLYPSLSFQKLLILACLNITEDFFEAKNQKNNKNYFQKQFLEIKEILDLE